MSKLSSGARNYLAIEQQLNEIIFAVASIRATLDRAAGDEAPRGSDKPPAQGKPAARRAKGKLSPRGRAKAKVSGKK